MDITQHKHKKDYYTLEQQTWQISFYEVKGLGPVVQSPIKLILD